MPGQAFLDEADRRAMNRSDEIRLQIAENIRNKFETKDSGQHETYDSGMVRDTEQGKPRFDLLLPLDVPFPNQFLTRCAELLERGARKYGERNWEKGKGDKELARAISSAIRHLVQWASGETDEDHAAAVVFNLLQAETLKYRMEGK